MKKETGSFIGEHSHFCSCGCDERMSEYIVKLPNEKPYMERQCKNCGRKYKVSNISGGTIGE